MASKELLQAISSAIQRVVKGFSVQGTFFGSGRDPDVSVTFGHLGNELFAIDVHQKGERTWEVSIMDLEKVRTVAGSPEEIQASNEKEFKVKFQDYYADHYDRIDRFKTEGKDMSKLNELQNRLEELTVSESP